MAWITAVCLLIPLPLVTTISQTFRESHLLIVPAKLETVQATQLKCFNDETHCSQRQRKQGGEGQNDNDRYIPEMEPGTPMATK